MEAQFLILIFTIYLLPGVAVSGNVLTTTSATTLQRDIAHADLNTLKRIENAFQESIRLVQDSIRRISPTTTQVGRQKYPVVGTSNTQVGIISSTPSNLALIESIRTDNLEAVGRSMMCGSFANLVDSRGYTLLHHAVSFNSSKVVKYLVEEAGADVHAKSRSELDTPLHLAVRRNYNGLAHYLMEQGADLGARNSMGFTPLHLAVDEGRKQQQQSTNFNACAFQYDKDISTGNDTAGSRVSNQSACCHQCLQNSQCRGLVFWSNKLLGDNCFLKGTTGMVPPPPGRKLVVGILTFM